MEDKIRINASVVSNIGMVSAENLDNFYMNGRFMYEHETDNIQVSVGDSGREYLFAVSDGMDRHIPEKRMVVSAVRELQKFQDRIKSSGKDINVKLGQLCECIEEVYNLLLSVSLSDGIHGRTGGSFAGIIISGGKAAVIGKGSTRVYMLREGSLTQLISDSRKTGRLLKLGIITDEQAEVLSKHFGINTEEAGGRLSKSDIFDVRPEDTFLLCTDGLPGTIDDEAIYELLARKNNSCHAANSLVSEAVKSEVSDNVTVMVVKIKQAGEEEEAAAPEKHGRAYRTRQTEDLETIEKKRGSVWKTAALFALCILIPVAMFWSYKLLLGTPEQIPAADMTTASSTTQNSETGETDPTKDIQPEPSPQSPDSEAQPQDTDTAVKTVNYKVKPGDSLYKLSMDFYGDPQKVKLIMEANNISNPDHLMVGQVLIIPSDEQGEQ
jgi:serine/threonine protein phosphatase PrpC/LysM repeat protein